MRALRKTANGVRIEEVSKPDAGNEALIKVKLSGICNTDLEIIRGYADFTGTLGHEFVGVVEDCPTAPEWNGKRVIGEINAGCRTCDWCREHDSRHCPNRSVLGILNRDGCHADYFRLPAANLIEVPDSISDERAVFAEPLAAAWGMHEQVEIGQETRVLVIGDGKLGILCAWSMAKKTQHLFLLGKHPNKLRIGELGNAEGVLAEDAGKFSRSMDVVVEASGSETGFKTALDIVKPRGKIILKSTFHGEPRWEAWKVVVNEATIIGSRCGLFEPVTGLLEGEGFPLEALISETYSMDDAIHALDAAVQPGVMKVLLKP